MYCAYSIIINTILLKLPLKLHQATQCSLMRVGERSKLQAYFVASPADQHAVNWQCRNLKEVVLTLVIDNDLRLNHFSTTRINITHPGLNEAGRLRRVGLCKEQSASGKAFVVPMVAIPLEQIAKEI